jgi:hypothetical protein
MQQKTVLYRVKEGKLDAWKEWAEEINSVRRQEAMETLKEEAVTREFSALFEIKGEYYVVGYMEGEIRPANRGNDINQKHDKIKAECLEFVSEGTMLYDLENGGSE